MPDGLRVFTTEAGEIGDIQARSFATAICGGVAVYIAEHQAEYLSWLDKYNRKDGVNNV